MHETGSDVENIKTDVRPSRSTEKIHARMESISVHFLSYGRDQTFAFFVHCPFIPAKVHVTIPYI